MREMVRTSYPSGESTFAATREHGGDGPLRRPGSSASAPARKKELARLVADAVRASPHATRMMPPVIEATSATAWGELGCRSACTNAAAPKGYRQRSKPVRPGLSRGVLDLRFDRAPAAAPAIDRPDSHEWSLP